MTGATTREPADWLRLVPSIVYTFDTDGVCTMSDGPGLAELGVRPGQLVGTDLLQLYADDPVLLGNLRRALAGDTFVVETAHQGRLLETYFQPVTAADGTVTGHLGVVSDVTEQRRLEDEAREGQRRSTALVDLTSALARDVVDVASLVKTAVRAATDGTRSSGALWTLTEDGSELRIAAFNPAVRDGAPVMPASAGRPGEVRASDLPRIDRRLVEGIPRARMLDLSSHAETVASFGDASVGTWLRGSGAHSCLRIPLRGRGHLLGALDLVRRHDAPPFTEQDVDFAVDVAERCALALDNALLLQAQRSALEERVTFAAMADATSDFIAITDTDRRVGFLNRRLLELGASWHGRDLASILAAHVREDALGDIERALGTAGRWSGDLTVDFGTGPVIVRAEAFDIFHPETGAPLGTVWAAQDVTELRGTERALRAANLDLLRFKSLVETCPEFIAIAAMDGTVQYLNPHGRRMVGLPADADVSATTIADYLTEEGLRRSVEVEQPAVLEHGFWEGESTLRDMRGGPPIPVSIASFLMVDPDSRQPIALATVQRDLTDRVRAESALRELAEQRQQLLTRLVEAQDAERAHIAAEVHDDSVQSLAAVELRLGLLTRRVREQAPALLEHVTPLRESVSEATDRLRALLFDLTPPSLDGGLAVALTETAREIFEDSGTDVQVVGNSAPGSAPAPLRVAHRIAREALFNARKHARATTVTVTISPLGTVGSSTAAVEVRVADDGVGLPEGPLDPGPGHLGLASMRDRAAIAGGEWAIHSRPAGGTEVVLRLPIPAPLDPPDSILDI